MIPRPHISTRTDTLFPYTTLVLSASHDRRYVGDLDIFARFDVRHAFGHVEVDFQILEILGDRSDVDLEPVIIAHRRPSLGSCDRSEEHTSELQSLMRNSYAVFCLKKKIE